MLEQFRTKITNQIGVLERRAQQHPSVQEYLEKLRWQLSEVENMQRAQHSAASNQKNDQGASVPLVVDGASTKLTSCSAKDALEGTCSTIEPSTAEATEMADLTETTVEATETADATEASEATEAAELSETAAKRRRKRKPALYPTDSDPETYDLLPSHIKKRLPPCGEVPPFDPEAHGGPLFWNNPERAGAQPMYWGRWAKSWFPRAADVEVDVGKVMQFFRIRKGPDGNPVSNLLGSPQYMEDQGGWFRLPWLAFNEVDLPSNSLGHHNGGYADWQKAWHGCKFEALYSILYCGRLAASADADYGERFNDAAPGVYVHKDSLSHKVGFYMRFVPLCRDGIFWSARWEVRVDRSDRVVAKGTDQWVQEERSVRLVALWLCGRRAEDLEVGWEVSRCWDPQMEANPFSRAEHENSKASLVELHAEVEAMKKSQADDEAKHAETITSFARLEDESYRASFAELEAEVQAIKKRQADDEAKHAIEMMTYHAGLEAVSQISD